MGKRILIIEDDATILAGMAAKFASLGYGVIQESGDKQQKDLWMDIARTKPSFLVLDLILPVVDSFELLGALKADPVLSKLPVFVFTNLSDYDTRERIKVIGAEYYFIKSEFNIDEFVDKAHVIMSNLLKISK